MTGEKVTVSKGQYLAVGDNDGNALYANDTATLVTNMTTKEQLKVKFGGVIKYGMLSGEMGYYVLSDEDYAKAAKGLAGQWIEGMTFFNIKSGDNYQFADSLYRGFIDSMDDKAPLQTYYDRVAKYGAEQRGEVYWGDTDEMTKLSFDHPDSSEFRQFWAYMPKIRTLDQNDFMRTLPCS